jgi:hypothetical protein
MEQSEKGLSPKDRQDMLKTDWEIKSTKQTMYLKNVQQASVEMEKWQKEAAAPGPVGSNLATKKSYAMAAVKFAFLSNPSLLTQTQNQDAILHGLPYNNTIKGLLTPEEINQIALDVTNQLSGLDMMSQSITSSSLPANSAVTQGTTATQSTITNDPTVEMTPAVKAIWLKIHPGTGH